MAAFTTIAVATLAAVSFYQGEESKREAKQSAERAAGEQRKAGAEQSAVNAAQAAAERRRQVREERVRRARIMQTAQTTGTAGSSGETGAIGGMATGLSSNLGANAGMQQKSVAISSFNQQAADFTLQSQQQMADAQSFQQLGSLSLSIFGAMGKGTPKAGATPLVDSTQIPRQPGGGY